MAHIIHTSLLRVCSDELAERENFDCVETNIGYVISQYQELLSETIHHWPYLLNLTLLKRVDMCIKVVIKDYSLLQDYRLDHFGKKSTFL